MAKLIMMVVFSSLFIVLSIGKHLLMEEKSCELQSGDCKPANKRFQIEDFTRFSKSYMWNLLLKYYNQSGIDAWSTHAVPSFITSNNYIANSYARVIKGFIQDCVSESSTMPLDMTENMYIIEVGTGSGIFSNYAIRALFDLKNSIPFPFHKIKYIMTDFREENLKFWESHPALEEFINEGFIDFALFNGNTDTSLKLTRTNITLSPGEVKNPIIVIANYVFDSLPQDIFQIRNGTLYEGLISVGSTENDDRIIDLLDPNILQRLNNLYEYRPISSSYYKDIGNEEEEWNRIIQWYKNYFISDSGSILLPIGALRTIKGLSALSSDRIMIMCTDKGIENPDMHNGIFDPHIAVHGSFSVLVNFHALGIYFAQNGGFALHDQSADNQAAKMSTFVMNGKHLSSRIPDNLDDYFQTHKKFFPQLFLNVNQFIRRTTPSDFLEIVNGAVDSYYVDLKYILCLLKLSNWDPATFFLLSPLIEIHLLKASKLLQRTLMNGLIVVRDRHFKLHSNIDVIHRIGRIYELYGDTKRSIEMYEESISEFGKSEEKLVQVASAYYTLSGTLDDDKTGKVMLSKALNYIKEALRTNPTSDELNFFHEDIELLLELYD